MTTKHRKTILSAMSSIVLFGAILYLSFDSSDVQGQETVAPERANLPEFPPLPEKDTRESIKEDALNVEGIKNWSSYGWKTSMAWSGNSTPEPHWEEVVVELRLDPGKGNPKIECENGWNAFVEYDLEKNKIVDSSYPTIESADCSKGNVTFERPSDHTTSKTDVTIPNFIQSAFATNTYQIATQDGVVNDRYGAFVHISTPAITEPDIWNDMNNYTAMLLNQDFDKASGPALMQVGWTLSTVDGEINKGISADEAQFAYVDQAYWGDLQPRKIPQDDVPYTEDSNAIVYIQCETGDTDYRQKVWSDGNFWQRTETGVECGTDTTSNDQDNSVWFENANTVDSSEWTDDITTSVEGWNAKEYRTQTNYDDWSGSTNKEQDCNGNVSNTDEISGTLANDNKATWDSLAQIDSACF